MIMKIKARNFNLKEDKYTKHITGSVKKNAEIYTNRHKIN